MINQDLLLLDQIWRILDLSIWLIDQIRQCGDFFKGCQSGKNIFFVVSKWIHNQVEYGTYVDTKNVSFDCEGGWV